MSLRVLRSQTKTNSSKKVFGVENGEVQSIGRPKTDSSSPKTPSVTKKNPKTKRGKTSPGSGPNGPSSSGLSSSGLSNSGLSNSGLSNSPSKSFRVASDQLSQTEPAVRRPSLLYNRFSPYSVVKFRKRLSYIPAQLRSALRKPGQARRAIPVCFAEEEEDKKSITPITEAAHQQDHKFWKHGIADRIAKVTPGPVEATGWRNGVTILVVVAIIAVLIEFIVALLSCVSEPVVRKYLPNRS